MSEERFDTSLNFLYRKQSQLDAIFSPQSVAVIGATEALNSVGRTVMQNLEGFSGNIYPINPKRPTVLGKKAYQKIADVPEKVDLAVIVTPAAIVPRVLAECAAAGVRGVVIISAGFKEMGREGEELEQELLRIARKGNMRLIGPNCLGVMRGNLNATFAADRALPGNLAFISQSGALCTAVLDWSLQANVGFSAFVSIGSMVDVSFGDLIDYFGNDPQTQTILIYMETIGDARSFLSAAREVSLTKPIILIKAGRSEESAKAAASHTGSLSGSDEVLSAALRRTGVLRVDTIEDLFSMADVLAKQKRPKGPHLTVITNAGGPGVIATDALIEGGGKLAPLSEEMKKKLGEFLPAHWSHNNPIDLLGDASAESYGKAVEIVSEEPQSDGVLVILTPQDMTDPTATAEKMKEYADLEKPLLTSWMGAESVAEGNKILQKAGIPTFRYPDQACKAFCLMWKYAYNLQELYEVPRGEVGEIEKSSQRLNVCEQIFHQVKKEKRSILDEVESKKVLQAYGIPIVPTEVAHSAEEAEQLAEKFGFPVVLKIYSRTITHKTDVGGVKLNLHNREEVKRAFHEIEESVIQRLGREHIQGVTVQPMIRKEGYELILGSSIDSQFGPVMLFGCGGQLVEVFKDRSLAIPPLTTTLARQMMEQTKIYHALQGVRGRKAVDLVRLEQILVLFSTLILEQPWIKECDINPLLASSDGLIALDARVILHDAEQQESLPKSAIRPYPTQYVESFALKSGEKVLLRPIRPDDQPLIMHFHEELSKETVRQRYLKVMHHEELVSRERLVRICFTDYDREIALVVEKQSEILGLGRLSKVPGSENAIFSVIVKDQWQNQGIGSKILGKIVAIAKKEGIRKLEAYMLQENTQMQELCKRIGFSIEKEGTLFKAQIDL